MLKKQRTALVFVWDLRAPMFEAGDMAERWSGAMDYLDRLYPATSGSRVLRGYMRPDQIEVERELGGLGFATRRVYAGMDTKIAQDIERLFDVEHRLMTKPYARERLPRLEPSKYGGRPCVERRGLRGASGGDEAATGSYPPDRDGTG